MTPEDALAIIVKILEPKQLSYIQEVIFLESWAGKLYREIALETGYDLDYVKEVGSQLWNALSAATGEKVTKKNVHLVLAHMQPPVRSRYLRSTSTSPSLTPFPFEFPTGPVPQQSPLYVARSPIEERVFAEMTRPSSLIRIKAPRQMGKTSLLNRLLMYAKQVGMSTVLINLHQVDNDMLDGLNSLNRFLRWFCLNVGQQLQLEPRLEEFWHEESGSKTSCTIYFQNYLLESLDHPLFLALDEINRLFEYPALAKDFLPLLRFWHEQATETTTWQKLRIGMAYSTEACIFLNAKESPFNVGFLASLPGFTLEQVQQLAERHQIRSTQLGLPQLKQLLTLVGGQPYLIRLALYHLYQENMSLEALLNNALTPQGIYGEHLRQQWIMVQQHPDLLKALYMVLQASTPVSLDAAAAYPLESMGLIQLNGSRARISCELYHTFFKAQLQEWEQGTDPLPE